mgnify:CR=1 FL=1
MKDKDERKELAAIDRRIEALQAQRQQMTQRSWSRTIVSEMR